MNRNNVRMNKNGFTLIECMIYCAMLATIMVIWFNGVASFTRVCTTCAYQTNLLSTVYSALDVFARDVRKAPQAIYAWPLITDTAFVFTLPDASSIGWEYKDGQLVRYQGNYDKVRKQWIKKAKSLILDTMQAGAFSYTYVNNNIASVNIAIAAYGKTYSRTSYIQ